MSGEHQMETRRRSRSKTPFLRSTCDHENCEFAGEEGHSHLHHKKKSAASPKVNTITEIEETVEVTSSSSIPTMKESQQKIKTSDYSSEDNSPESRKIKSRSTLESHQNKQSASSSSNMYTTTTTTSSSTNIIIKSKRLGGASLAAATSTPKANYAVESFLSQYASSDSLNRAGLGEGGGGGRGGGGLWAEKNIESTSERQRRKEVTQNELNAEHERTQREEEALGAAANKTANSDGHISRRKQNNSSNRSFSRFFSSSFGSAAEQSRDINDHIAYREYKRAGEYWKTTPKTDYTYSELSPHRRELAPGVVAMPNMSRRSLENHHERIHYMIERDPAQESYIRRRYESSKYAQNRRDAAKLVYDSGDEADASLYKDYGMKREDWWFVSILTTIVTTFSSAWQTLSGKVTGVDDSALYRTRISQEERGFFGSIGHGVSAAFIGFFRYIYLLISSVLSFDTWLLQSSNAENKGKKRLLLFLLCLVPLLLLAGWKLLDESQRVAYLQRSQSLLPISTLFATLSQTLSTSTDGLKGYLQQTSSLFSNLLPSQSKSTHEEANINLYHMQQNIQKSLSPEEYENILNHINSYVQQLVDAKLLKQQQAQETAAAQLTPQMMLSIAEVVKEQLGQIQMPASGFDLSAITDAELDLIAQRAQVRLETVLRNSKKVALTQAHLEQIRQLIQERIEVNNNHYYTTLEHIDLEALLARILAAPQLAKFIDARVISIVDGKLSSVQAVAEGSGGTGAQLESQNLLINELNKEIAFIKLTLADKLSENQDLHQSISNLKLGQEDLLQRLHAHELSTDKRFSALLSEIESKLSTLRDEQFTLLNKQIKLSLVEILGFKQTNGAKLNDVDLQSWVRNMFVAKDFLEQRLLEINARTNDKIREEIDRSGMLLMRDISERLKQEILIAVDAKQNDSQAVVTGHLNAALSEEAVKDIVKNVLAIYDADKTGLVDFALESAGGQILSTRCTESYQTKTAQISVFGIPLWYPTNTPRVAISPNVQPGECWAFQGFPGFLVLKLNSMVYVTGFTLEHIPKSLSPNGRIDSAPRNFTVWGLEHEKDQEPVLFGEYEYADNDASLQYFPLQNKQINRPYDIVELRIESNHGHPAYTCLYRFRVHGKPPAT